MVKAQGRNNLYYAKQIELTHTQAVKLSSPLHNRLGFVRSVFCQTNKEKRNKQENRT